MLTRTLQIFSLVCLGLIVGCSSKTEESKKDKDKNAKKEPNKDADPHDIPLTEKEIADLKKATANWDAAIEKIQSYRTTIKTETTTGEPKKAHRALDLLNEVLGWLTEVAKNSNVPKDDWATIGEDAEKLAELFEKVHKNIDDGKAPDYEAVGADIDKIIDRLVAIKVEESVNPK